MTPWEKNHIPPDEYGLLILRIFVGNYKILHSATENGTEIELLFTSDVILRNINRTC